ncbi:MAG: PEP-CTERM sorting domain-containing protein [Phycisphaeraceae bacterium]|nr:PEP-CTERM sorting domain-containing protein [Phycisphaeraceae bacterium]
MKAHLLIAAAASLAAALPAAGDDWLINMTVDNRFDVYFGTPTATNFYAGGGNNWTVTYTITATGRAATDYLYVATASDRAVAQGFIGEFTNTTTNLTTVTGDAIWEVFPAGAYLTQLGLGPGPWPTNVQPTQAQVDLAIAYATINNLWVTPGNGGINGVSPWGARPGISPNARWIWHNANNAPDPTIGGFNHDEFLVFRIAGAVPTPGALALLGMGGLVAARRRRD